MDQIGHDQHVDLAAELGQRTGQATAVFATLLEASARLAAEELRRRERRDEQQRAADEQRAETTQRLREQSDQLSQHAAQRRAQHDRRTVAQATDPDWLARADLLDLANVWRTARVREHEFPEAAEAAEKVEERLREMYPRPMDLYDEAVRCGVPRADAMRSAAQEMVRTPVMRAHGGGRAGALDGADEVVGDEPFATAVSDEQIRLATGVDPASYAEELSRLGAAGEAAAQALREALAAQAGREMTQGHVDTAIPDNPATASVAEHATVGMPSNARDVGAANRDGAAARTRNAADVAGEWYPEGLNNPSAMPAHVTGKRPANATPTHNPTRTAGRAR
jgi:hypothetical protein